MSNGQGLAPENVKNIQEADSMLGENCVVVSESDEKSQSETKLYRIRWIVLLLFIFYAASNAMQWIQYSIITNIIMKYYGVSSLAVDWTSMIAMITYPPLIIPGSYIIDRMGLRICALLGVIGTTIGTWIKVFSVRPDLFWVGFLGQTVVFVSQIFILSLPPRIAAVWFGPDEVSSACSLGVFGTQLGTALGFILPPMIVKNHENLEDIGNELSYMFYGVALYTTPIVLLVCVFVKPEPVMPPSPSQLKLRTGKIEFTNKQFWASYKALVTNVPFVMLMVSYGMNIGVFAAICTLLNQFILSYFPNSEEDAGRIGLLLIIVGMIGSIIFGVVLDKTKKYKETTLGLYFMSVVGLISFMFALEARSKPLVYIAGSFLGFFQNAYYPVGFELASELTYPQPESTSSGLLTSMAQIFGVINTLLLGWIFSKVGAFWAMGLMAGLLVVGTGLTMVTPNRLRRQEAIVGRSSDVRFTPVKQ